MNWLTLTTLAVLCISCHGTLFNPRARCPVRTLKNGRVRVQGRGRISRYTCSRGYHLVGNKYASCVINKWDSPTPVCIRDGCDQIDVPHAEVFETYRGALVSVHCDPGYTLIGTSSLYCNGVNWNDTAPICRANEVTIQKSCDFESEDLCGWTHGTNHDFDWKRHSFATPSGYVGTGPSFDHTLGPGLNGHYMYLETSSPRLENDTARLFSPIFSAQANQSCFIFWYHMFGFTTGYLNVFLHSDDSQKLLFTKSGDQGDQWQEAVLTLPSIDSDFQIVIEGVRGPGYEGDTAIDDVKLTDGDECFNYMTTESEEGDDASCEGRCFLAPDNLSQCECTPDCISNNTCCPDYVQMCSPTSTVQPAPTLSKETVSRLDSDSKIIDKITEETTAVPNVTRTNKTMQHNPNKTSIMMTKTSQYVLKTNPTTTTTPYTTKTTTTTKYETKTIPTKSTTMQYVPKTISSIFTRTSYLTKTTTKITTPYTPKTNPIASTTTTNTPYIIRTNPTSTESKTTFSRSTKTTVEPKSTWTTIQYNPALEKILEHRDKKKSSATSLPVLPPTSLPSKTVPVYNTSLSPVLQENITHKIWKPVSKPTSSYKKIPLYTKKPLISPTIKFITPPPPIVFRTPAKIKVLQKPTVSLPNISKTTFWQSTSYPTLLNNPTKPNKQSKNDVLHPHWQKLNSTGQLDSKFHQTNFLTSQPHSPRGISQQESGFDYKTASENKWKTKYKSAKGDEDDSHKQQLHKSTSSNKIDPPTVLVVVLLLIVSTVVSAMFLFRRNKVRQRNIRDDELDIRFLASDESLNFTLATATPHFDSVQEWKL